MGTMVTHITMTIITATLILMVATLSIITLIRIIMPTIMIDTDDHFLAMKRTEEKLIRKESWLHLMGWLEKPTHFFMGMGWDYLHYF